MMMTSEQNFFHSVGSKRVLVVGAGGIGCEVLKNLVLSGFLNIEVVDLDTIDVSNLNRQFLFHKEHVGQPKAVVAAKAAMSFNPKATVVHHHDSIFKEEFSLNYFSNFDVVINALDNQKARRHVNRMCMHADVPLVETGTAGYLGQVQVIKKGTFECYECIPKMVEQKTFPGCTIRNTPSEPIHCIVWGKHLFNQLFGEDDSDQDVSPDTEDPEAAGDAGANALGNEELVRRSTKEWAKEVQYSPEKLFTKFFTDDVKYLLSMEKLWENRRRPEPLDVGNLNDSVPSSLQSASEGLSDQEYWSMKTCFGKFRESLDALVKSVASQSDGILVWDKDDDASLDFVCATANIRCFIFGITQKNRFEIKEMAGNIIPAIATTNAIVAGQAIVEAFNVLKGDWGQCHLTFINKKMNYRGDLWNPGELQKPSPNCYICQDKPGVGLRVNAETFHVKTLEQKVLKDLLHMSAPDVEVDGRGTILISSDEDDRGANDEKTFAEFHISSGARLRCDDFDMENYKFDITIYHESAFDGEQYEIIGDPQRAIQLVKQQNTTQNNGSNGISTMEKTSKTEQINLKSKKRSIEEVNGAVEKNGLKLAKYESVN